MAAQIHSVHTITGTIIEDPPVARLLFNDTRLAWVWMCVRVMLSFAWLDAALQKLNDPAWMQTGTALRDFWENALKIPLTGEPPITYDWYRNLIVGLLDAGSYTWMAKGIAIGELVIGVALFCGIFVGIAAFAGALMSWSLMLAGTTGGNAVLIIVSVLLILAWKTAGWYGADRYLLPRLGTPWQPAFRGIEVPSRAGQVSTRATGLE